MRAHTMQTEGGFWTIIRGGTDELIRTHLRDTATADEAVQHARELGFEGTILTEGAIR